MKSSEIIFTIYSSFEARSSTRVAVCAGNVSVVINCLNLTLRDSGRHGSTNTTRSAIPKRVPSKAITVGKGGKTKC